MRRIDAVANNAESFDPHKPRVSSELVRHGRRHRPTGDADPAAEPGFKRLEGLPFERSDLRQAGIELESKVVDLSRARRLVAVEERPLPILLELQCATQLL